MKTEVVAIVVSVLTNIPSPLTPIRKYPEYFLLDKHEDSIYMTFTDKLINDLKEEEPYIYEALKLKFSLYQNNQLQFMASNNYSSNSSVNTHKSTTQTKPNTDPTVHNWRDSKVPEEIITLFPKKYNANDLIDLYNMNQQLKSNLLENFLRMQTAKRYPDRS